MAAGKQIAEAYVLISADTSGLAAGIQKDVNSALKSVQDSSGGLVNGISGDFGMIEGKTRGLMSLIGDGLSSTFKTVVSVAKAGFGALATTVTAAGGYALVAGYKFNVLNQRSLAAFTTILGSGEAAKKMMDQVGDFASESPFPKQAFIEATQQMLGFGVAAEDIVPTLGAIQDAVAAVGGTEQDIVGITRAFSDLQSRGKLTGETLYAFGSYGINAADIIAKKMGKTGDEIVKMASSPGGIPADQVFGPLVDGLNDKFGGAAANVKKTWVGAMDRVKANLRTVGSSLLEPFISKEGGGAAIDWANQIADMLSSVSKNVLPGLQSKIESLVPVLTDLLTKALDFVTSLTTGKMSGLMDTLKKAAPILAGLGGAFGVLGSQAIPIIGTLTAGMSPLVTGIMALVFSIPEVRDVFMDLLNTLGTTLSGLMPLITPVVEALSGALTEALTALAPVIVTVVEVIASSLMIALEALLPVLPTVVEAIGKIATALAGALGEALETIAPLLPDLVTAFADLAVMLITSLVPILPKLLAALLPLLPSIVDLVPPLVDLAVAALDLVTALPPGVIQAIAVGFLAFKTASGPITAVAGGLKSVVGVSKGLASIPGVISSMAKTQGISKLSSAFKVLKTSILETKAGTVALGIAQKVQAAFSKAAAAATAIWNAVMAVNPVILVVVAIVALGAAVIAAYKNIKPFRDLMDSIGRYMRDVVWPALKDVGTYLKGAFLSAWNAVKGPVESLGKIFMRIGKIYTAFLIEPIKTGVQFVKDVMTGDFTKAFDGLKELPKNILKAFGDIPQKVGKFFSDLPDNITKALDKLGDALLLAVKNAVKWLIANGPAIMASIGNFFKTVGTSAVDLFIAALRGIVDIAPKIAGWLGDLGLMLFGFLSDAFMYLVENGPGIIAGFLEWVGTLTVTIIKGIGSFGLALFTFLGEAFLYIITNGPKLLLKFYLWWGKLNLAILVAIGNFGLKLFDFLKEGLGYIISNGGPLLLDLLAWFGKLPGKILGAMPGLGNKLFQFVKGAFSYVVEHGPEAITGVLGWFGGFIGKVLTSIKEGITSIGSEALSFASTLWEAIADFVNTKLIQPIRDYEVSIGPWSKKVFSFLPLLPTTFHTGGIVGESGFQAKTGALRPDEMMTILQKGEGVLPVNVMDSLGKNTFKALLAGAVPADIAGMPLAVGSPSGGRGAGASVTVIVQPPLGMTREEAKEVGDVVGTTASAKLEMIARVRSA